MDSRRPFTELDVQMLEWFAPTGKPIHCILTKADKPKRTELEAVLEEITLQAAKHPAAHPHIFSTSSETGTGIAELRTAILEATE